MQRRKHALLDLIVQSLLIILIIYLVIDTKSNSYKQFFTSQKYSYHGNLLGAITVYPTILLTWQIINTCITVYGYKVKNKLPWIKIGAITLLIWLAVLIISFLLMIAVGDGSNNIFGDIISNGVPLNSWFSAILILLFVLINWILTIKDILSTRVKFI
ncbi:MAG: hypothetical protein MK212_01595 [Saprospiraceae bacterium]|nr:hypothetical protein [Saprospiraceae bacterium]